VLLVWTVTLLVVVAAPLAFPDWPAASFFSATLVDPGQDFDFLALYIPENPFRSLADGVVPAVVVFSLAFGLSLMGSDRKQGLLGALIGAQDALRRLASAVVRLAPYGIFAVVADAAGTIAPGALAGLQVYTVTYVALSLVVALWILPRMVAAVTPLSYREVLAPGRDAVVTAFATGSLFIVLPLLADGVRRHLEQRGAGEQAGGQVDVVIPIAFTLAGAGKLLGLVFVLYAGWQSGFPIAPSQYPAFAVAGLFSSFAGSVVSIPFMLDLFRVPTDTFQLYLIVDSLIGNRFSALTGSVHALSLALVAGAGAAAWVRIDSRRLVVWAATSVIGTGAVLGAIHLGFQRFDSPYTGYRTFIQRSFLLPTVPWRDRDTPPPPEEGAPSSTLQRIRERGAVRVGYARDRLPYVFRNESGELVGFDVEMAHALARDMGVRVEFFRTDPELFPRHLSDGSLDIVMTGLPITPERLERMRLSTPVVQETLAFIVRDYRRNEFRSRDAVLSNPALKLAVPDRGYYRTKIRELLPDVEIEAVESPRDFFRAEGAPFDALVFAAEAGSAWTLIYPQYTVAVLRPDPLRVPIGYATSPGDRRMGEYIDAWIQLKRNDHTIDRLFAYWFEGKDPPSRTRRWSVARDVLGWGEARKVTGPPAGESVENGAEPGAPE
jgi:Na+/H+-dicarboxylate symporter/ABC-type amino acid transport substrate-binding protein